MIKNSYLNTLWLTLALFLTLSGCSQDTSDEPSIDNTYIETGDLQAIQSHNQLRILTRPVDERWLPRDGNSFNSEYDMAQKLAEHLNLQPVFISVDKFEDLIPALSQGKGDIIGSNLTITPDRKEKVSFSVPLTHSREHIVSRNYEGILRHQQLNNRSIAYQPETSFENTINNLQKKLTGINFQVLSGHLNQDQVIDQLVSKKIDLSIMDSSTLEILKTYRDDFKIQLPLTNERALAWASRKDNPELLQAINQFLTHEKLTQKLKTFYTDDLDAIKKRKTLRVITRNNAASYYLWQGQLLGFEYEMVKAFAKQHNLRLEVITAPSHEAQIPMLLEGRGDIIASFMTITEKRKDKGVIFSRPHHKSSHVIVSRSDDKSINKPADLQGRNIVVRKSSAYWGTLKSLQQSGIKFNVQEAPEDMETEEIIAMVASGEYDLTLADDHLLDIELTWRNDIQAALTIKNNFENSWVMRNTNPQLNNAVNSFIKKQYKSLFYNVTYNKYFKISHRIKKHQQQRLDLQSDGTLSPYDSLVKKYAQIYDFDWRLLVSQMYQESRFNPKAKSWVGAQGLMQVMPRTAKELGITNLTDPESGIKAGIKYLQWVRNRFEPELDVKDRMWFTLAAYNAGQGHVKDARRLAKQQGLNPNRWFDNVEKAILLLSKRKYASKARHGYVRGTEPVNYVREIRQRYQAYLEMANTDS